MSIIFPVRRKEEMKRKNKLWFDFLTSTSDCRRGMFRLGALEILLLGSGKPRGHDPLLGVGPHVSHDSRYETGQTQSTSQSSQKASILLLTSWWAATRCSRNRRRRRWHPCWSYPEHVKDILIFKLKLQNVICIWPKCFHFLQFV